MLNHITLRVSNLLRSKAFYVAALASLGYQMYWDTEGAGGFATENKDGMRDFWIKEGGMAKEGHSFSCLAFDAPDKSAVDKFHAAALAAGGKDNGAPGERPEYHSNYYAAFVLDPDGYTIQAVFDKPSREEKA